MSSFELTDDIDTSTNDIPENEVCDSLTEEETKLVYECVQNYAELEELKAIQTESTAEIAHAVWSRSSFKNMDYKDFIDVHGKEIFGPTLKSAIDNLYANWAFLLNTDDMELLDAETKGVVVTGRKFPKTMTLSKYTLEEVKERVRALLDLQDRNKAKNGISNLRKYLKKLTKPWKQASSMLFYPEEIEIEGISFFSKVYFLLRSIMFRAIFA
jgi:hypothetical protein